MRHVFTYGSLMFPRVWSGVVAGSYPAVAATLTGFRRQRVVGQDYPSLQRIEAGDATGGGSDGGSGGEPSLAVGSAVCSVDGIVYLGVQAADLAALDAFEGPEYCRIQVRVTVRAQVAQGPAPGSVLPADTYLFTATDRVEPGLWDPQDFERTRIERFLRRFPPPRST